MSDLVVIAGPTASGKTALAIKLAKAVNAEIINADSRQFYRGLDIGTAKPTGNELATVPHHFIDIKSPNEAYNAGTFENQVLSFLEEYFSTKPIAILVGGSGLYIKAVLEGFDNLPSDVNIKSRLSEKLKTKGLEALQKQLLEKDPDYNNMENLQNPQRVIRAIEIMEITGTPISKVYEGLKKNRDFRATCFYLNPPRQHLYDRINSRVDQMIESGLEQEVMSLQEFRNENALQTVGYKEWFAHFDGTLDRNQTIEKIKQHSRNYAKRQITWFKNQGDFTPVESDYFNTIVKHLKEKQIV